MQNLVYARMPGVDYGHELVSSLALYPQITELTTVETVGPGLEAPDSRSECKNERWVQGHGAPCPWTDRSRGIART